MFSVSLIMVAITIVATADASAVKTSNTPFETIMDMLKMGSERFLSSSEKRSIPMDDGAGGTTCSDGRISELFSELSESCQNYLFQATAEYEFEEESTIICESCGRPLYSLLECLNSGPTELELFDVLCTENENGDNCYSLLSGDGAEEDEIIAECGDMACSDECRRILQESFEEYGCCLYSLVAINGSEAGARDLWAACGITEPGMCAPAFIASPSLPTLPPVDVEESPDDDEEEPTTIDEASSSTTQPPNTETSHVTPAATETAQPTSASSPTTATTTEEEGTTTGSPETAAGSTPTAEREPDSQGEDGGTDTPLLQRGAADVLMVNCAVSLVVPVLISAAKIL